MYVSGRGPARQHGHELDRTRVERLCWKLHFNQLLWHQPNGRKHTLPRPDLELFDVHVVFTVTTVDLVLNCQCNGQVAGRNRECFPRSDHVLLACPDAELALVAGQEPVQTLTALSLTSGLWPPFSSPLRYRLVR